MSKKAYVAFDLGAESGRAMLGILDDGKLELQEMHRFANLPQRLPSGYHWNLLELWRNLVEGLGKCAGHAREHGFELASLGVDTWGVDCGYLGKSGQLLGLPYAYRDDRFPLAMDRTLKALGEKQIYDVTGIQFMPFNTLFQVVAQQGDEAGVLGATDRLLNMPDLLHYFFTGERVNEYSIASTTQMLDAEKADWATGMLDDLGLPTDMLGPIVPSGTKIGKVLPEVRLAAGLEADMQVVAPASHDTASAVAAVPAVTAEKSWCYLSSGTWSLLGAELTEPLINDDARAMPFTNEGGVDGTIRFLKNISGLWLVQEVRRAWASTRQYSYEELTELAGHCPSFRTLVDPDHEPFASPGQMPEKIAAFARQTGQPEPEDIGQHVRCCLESLALTYRHTLAALERVLGRQFEVMHIVGGGGRNELLNQMTADAIGRPVVVGPYEATAAGNVLVQAMGLGDLGSLSDIRQVVAASFEPTTYQPQDPGAWDEAYQRYQELLGR